MVMKFDPTACDLQTDFLVRTEGAQCWSESQPFDS